jgi:hypothetical protein
LKRTITWLTLILCFNAVLLFFDHTFILPKGELPIQSKIILGCIIAEILIIGIPFIRRQSLLILILIGIILYVVVDQFSRSFIFQGSLFAIYQSFSQIILLSMSIFLSNRFAREWIALDQFYQQVILPKQSPRLYTMEKALPLIEDEFIRGRRYGYPISGLMINFNNPPNVWPSSKDLERSMQELALSLKERYLHARIAKTISLQTRHNDMIVELEEEGLFFILLPEITSNNSAVVANRLYNAIQKDFGFPISFGKASFPIDAVTFEALLEKTKADLKVQA